MGHNKPLKSWKKFAKKVRSNGCQLLSELHNFPDAVLVSGCQRSGGTMLSNIISHSNGMVNFAWSKDDELDAAQILSGYTAIEHTGRYCFQTTYLNECFREYFSVNSEFKLIWLLRNPYSVVYSLLYNWKRFALNELFPACGASLLDAEDKKRLEKFGLLSVGRLKRACLSYNAKISQIKEISENLAGRVLILDYDDLVSNKQALLPAVYRFIKLEYDDSYADKIKTTSLAKAKKLSNKEQAVVEKLCEPVYNDLKSLINVYHYVN